MWKTPKGLCNNSEKGVWDEKLLGEEGDPLGVVQENEIWPYYQIVYEQARICLRE